MKKIVAIGFFFAVQIFFAAWLGATQEAEQGISFDAPAGAWRSVRACDSCIKAWRHDDGSKIGLKRLSGPKTKNAARLLSEAVGPEAALLNGGRPLESNLGNDRATILTFAVKGAPSNRGALIEFNGKNRGLAVLCTSAEENFMHLFLECRHFASSIVAGDESSPGAAALHESGLKAFREDPARAAKLFESAIAADPGLAIAYLDLARALLARGDSAEMVAARLARMLERAPDTPDIRGMRERLARAR